MQHAEATLAMPKGSLGFSLRPVVMEHHESDVALESRDELQPERIGWGPARHPIIAVPYGVGKYGSQGIVECYFAR